MTFTEADFVPVTTWSRHRRHWALVAELRPVLDGAGHVGDALCFAASGATDQEATEALTRRYGLTASRYTKPIADMVGCQICDRAKARRLAVPLSAEVTP